MKNIRKARGKPAAAERRVVNFTRFEFSIISDKHLEDY